MFFLLLFLACSSLVLANNVVIEKYRPDWKDLDKRPLPEWYDRAKVGIMLHWGVYSVPSYGSEWFWNYLKGEKYKEFQEFMKKNYRPDFTYQDFASMFSAEFFDPDEWAKLFANAGAKYVVLTSKHHEGFTLYPSTHSFSWNSVDVGPKRDIVGELAEATRKQGLTFGTYHSLYEWYNPIYLKDRESNFTTEKFTKTKLWPDIKQLVYDYNTSVIWADGDWEAYDSYWKSKELLAWLYNESPVKDHIVVNDRWGIGTGCKHGDFYNCQDSYNPGILQLHKWENAFKMDMFSWGYRRNIKAGHVLNIESLLFQLVSTVSCGGNVLINVGPTKEGTIIPIFQEKLIQLGQWLQINGEAIYNSSPWYYQNDSIIQNVWYTCSKENYNGTHPTYPPVDGDKLTAVFAIFLDWPSKGVLELKNLASVFRILGKNIVIQLLGNESMNLEWELENNKTVTIKLPDQFNIKSKYAWVLKVTEYKNS